MLVLREEKGSELTFEELDGNQVFLDQKIGVSHTDGIGLTSTDVLLQPNPIVILQNGSAIVNGSGFLSTGPRSLDNNYTIYIKISDFVYTVYIDTIDSDTNATIDEIYDFILDPEENNNLGPNWPFSTGEYEALKIFTFNKSNSVEYGTKNIVSNNQTIAIGSDNRTDAGIAIGSNNYVKSESLHIGSNNKHENAGSAGSSSVLVGFGNINKGLNFPAANTQILVGVNNIGHSQRSTCIGEQHEVGGAYSSALGGGQNTINAGIGNSLLNCRSSLIGVSFPQPPGPQSFVVGIGLDGQQLDDISLQNIVVVNDLLILGLPVFADDAAAGAGGLIGGRVYRTAAGELRIKL